MDRFEGKYDNEADKAIRTAAAPPYQGNAFSSTPGGPEQVIYGQTEPKEVASNKPKEANNKPKEVASNKPKEVASNKPKEANNKLHEPTSHIVKKEPQALIAGLPTVIDVGGQLFDLKSEQNVNTGFFGRTTFQRTFHPSKYNSLPVEFLLRTYLPIRQTIKDIIFDPPEHRDQLIKVLRLRVNQLRTSHEYGSSVVKNIPIKKYELRLLEIIDELKEMRKGESNKNHVDIPPLDKNQLFQLLLEIAWYLAHPGQVPKEIRSEWKTMLEHLQKSPRLGDIMDLIEAKGKEEGRQDRKEDEPLRYFKKIDMVKFAEAPTLEEAKQRVADMVTLVEPQSISDDMRNRIRQLLAALALKGYIDENPEKTDEEKLKGIDFDTLDDQLADNPLKPNGSSSKGGAIRDKKVKKVKKVKGGAGKEPEESTILTLALGQAILPMFRYFRMLFDPVYSLLEEAVPRSFKRGLFPHLLLLLHLCNELQTPPAGRKFEYGLYHIANIPDLLVTFLTEQLRETKAHIDGLPQDIERVAFQKQLFHLPKVRLRSLIRNDGELPTMADEQHSIFHLQFFVVGQNLLSLDEAEFLKANPGVQAKVGDVIRNTWKPSHVFLAFTDSATTTENIPFRFFEVDYRKLDVRTTGNIVVGSYSGELDALVKTEGYFPKPEDQAYLEKVAKVEPYAIYNDAELALSTLMALKEHMPTK